MAEMTEINMSILRRVAEQETHSSPCTDGSCSSCKAIKALMPIGPVASWILMRYLKYPVGPVSLLDAMAIGFVLGREYEAVRQMEEGFKIDG